MLARLAEFFGAVAPLLAPIGLYGILNYLVAQRDRELGVRIAAAAANIARLVMVRVMAMVMLGAIVGVLLGLISVRCIEALLYGVKGTGCFDACCAVCGVARRGIIGFAARGGECGENRSGVDVERRVTRKKGVKERDSCLV